MGVETGIIRKSGSGLLTDPISWGRAGKRPQFLKDNPELCDEVEDTESSLDGTRPKEDSEGADGAADSKDGKASEGRQPTRPQSPVPRPRLPSPVTRARLIRGRRWILVVSFYDPDEHVKKKRVDRKLSSAAKRREWASSLEGRKPSVQLKKQL